jgi:hypothetical protein
MKTVMTIPQSLNLLQDGLENVSQQQNFYVKFCAGGVVNFNSIL